MNMAQKIAHGSSAKHMLSKFDRGTDLGLGKTETRKFRVRQELWKAVEEKISGTSEGSTVEMKKKALSYIVLSVTNNILRRIAAVESASKAWRELEVLYSEDLLASRHRLNKKEVQEKVVFMLCVSWPWALQEFRYCARHGIL